MALDRRRQARARSFTRPRDLLRERAEHIGRILTQEQGKPLAEAKAEVIGSAQLFDWYAEEIKRDYGRTLVRPRGPAVAGHPPAGRPGRDLHAVEFPDLSAGQESRRRARRRLHGDHAARRRKRPGCTGELFRALADAGIPAGVAQLVHGKASLVSTRSSPRR